MASAAETVEDELEFEQQRNLRPRSEYFWSREIFVRGLGFIYLVAFTSLLLQGRALFGERGLLPLDRHLESFWAFTVAESSPVFRLPTVFWWLRGDEWIVGLSAVGILLSIITLAGFGSSLVLFCLWGLQLSFVHVGQTFYSFGWEILLLEVGLIAVFMSTPRRLRVRAAAEPPFLMILALRWTLFRLMLGAGLIKVRGDGCWTDLSCLFVHYETQPNPHPLSWLLHQAADWFHQGGVLVNHFAELIVPFGFFGPRRLRHFSGVCTVVFQGLLIFSGNLSFLNWLTIVLAFACFDDTWWRALAKGCGCLRKKCAKEVMGPEAWTTRLCQRFVRVDVALRTARAKESSRAFRVVVTVYALVVLALSLNPLMNLLGPRQRMNESYDPFHLVNSYGAFGSVGKTRLEVIVEGTREEMSASPESDAEWKAYEFPCKPGALDRVPCFVTPYHHRLAWQMWFAAQGSPETDPWLVHLAAKLMEGDERALSLVETNPFVDAPPRQVRIRLMEYHFTHLGQDGWWTRRELGQWMRPVALEDPELDAFLRDRSLR